MLSHFLAKPTCQRYLAFTANLLSSIVKKYGDNDKDFVDHIGGDDFVIIITDREKGDLICTRKIKYFDRLIKRYYDPETHMRGGIYGFPLGDCGNEPCQAKLFPFYLHI